VSELPQTLKRRLLKWSKKDPNTFKRELLIWSNKNPNTEIACGRIGILNGLRSKDFNERRKKKTTTTYKTQANIVYNAPKQIVCSLKSQAQVLLCGF
jgi:hypothetical protein